MEQGYINVVIDLANECDVQRYEHEILRPSRIHELISLAKSINQDGRRLLVGTSYTACQLPDDSVMVVSDFILMHGNGIHEPARIREMVAEIRGLLSYRPMPIQFNRDDHYDFHLLENNFTAALASYAGWGYFDPGQAAGGRSHLTADYRDGFQIPPVNWRINTPRKRAFFEFLA